MRPSRAQHDEPFKRVRKIHARRRPDIAAPGDGRTPAWPGPELKRIFKHALSRIPAVGIDFSWESAGESGLVLTQRLAYAEVIVTNWGMLVAPSGLDCGKLTLTRSTLSLGTNSTVSDALLTNSRLFASNGVSMTGNVVLAATNYLRGTGSFGSLVATGTNIFDGAFSASSLLVGSNGVLTTLPRVPLVMSVAGQMRILAGGMLDVRDLGYQLGEGPGYGGSTGGSYGGLGGLVRSDVVAKPTYGLAADPNDFGSSGSFGNGGGLIRVAAQSLVLEGTIRADAADIYLDFNGPGAGSGGGIRLDVGTLTGSGVILADGGDSRGTTYYYDHGAAGAVADASPFIMETGAGSPDKSVPKAGWDAPPAIPWPPSATAGRARSI